jgi:TetR/AcrR family transcriptional repressor of nem operon
MQLKDKIIHESLRLFSLKGFSSTTIDDILRAAGSSKGGFYNHFKNKEDLFSQVLKEARTIWRQRNLVGLDQNRKPVANLKLFLENFRDYYLKDSENFPGGCIFITLLVELKDQNPHLAEEINKGFIGMRNMMLRYLKLAQDAGEMKKNIDIEAMTAIIFSGMLGATIIYNADRSEVNVNRTIGYIIDYVESMEVDGSPEALCVTGSPPTRG